MRWDAEKKNWILDVEDEKAAKNFVQEVTRCLYSMKNRPYVPSSVDAELAPEEIVETKKVETKATPTSTPTKPKQTTPKPAPAVAPVTAIPSPAEGDIVFEGTGEFALWVEGSKVIVGTDIQLKVVETGRFECMSCFLCLRC